MRCHLAAYALLTPHSLPLTTLQAWVLNESVRSNITFGSPFDAAKYAAVVACCALQEDLEQLHAGDATEVGEQGIVISGGQKQARVALLISESAGVEPRPCDRMQPHDATRLHLQRISLARACYAGADVYLLDDPLSAVDSHVARHLFERCIVGALSGSSRVLVTHKLELLPHADHVVVMRDGRAVFQGTYKELLGSGLDLTALLPKEEVEAGAELAAELSAAAAAAGAGAEGAGAKGDDAKGGGAAVQPEKATRAPGPRAAGDGKLMDAEEHRKYRGAP